VQQVGYSQQDGVGLFSAFFSLCFEFLDFFRYKLRLLEFLGCVFAFAFEFGYLFGYPSAFMAESVAPG